MKKPFIIALILTAFLSVWPVVSSMCANRLLLRKGAALQGLLSGREMGGQSW